MIAAQDEEVLGVHDFIAYKETDSFERLFAAVDIVTEEEIIAFGGEATIFE